MLLSTPPRRPRRRRRHRNRRSRSTVRSGMAAPAPIRAQTTKRTMESAMAAPVPTQAVRGCARGQTAGGASAMVSHRGTWKVFTSWWTQQARRIAANFGKGCSGGRAVSFFPVRRFSRVNSSEVVPHKELFCTETSRCEWSCRTDMHATQTSMHTCKHAAHDTHACTHSPGPSTCFVSPSTVGRAYLIPI